MSGDEKLKKFLSSRKGGRLRVSPSKLQDVKPGENLVGIAMYPPNNAVATFKLGKYSVPKPRPVFEAVVLPENWTNFTSPSNARDTEKYKLTTRPMNQGLCGSCFACATATCINDAFIFSGLNFNPNLSPMYTLACLNNAKCGGGDALDTLNQIEKYGIVSNHCLDYNSICQSSEYCLPKSSGQQADTEAANSIIPICGCCAIGKDTFCPDNKSPNHYKYYVKNIELVATNDTNSIPNAVQYIKEHLFKYGAAVSAFQVYDNFFQGGSEVFSDTNGVYIESEPYGSRQPDALDGFHAISIVGWGIEKKPITLKNGVVIPSTPYWVVRNSWGRKWGDNGYFKFAMYQSINTPDGKTYEVNPTTALERFNKTSVSSAPVGGIILFKPSSYKEYDESSSNCSYMSQLQDLERQKEVNFYCNEPLPTSSGGSSDNGGEDVSGDFKHDKKSYKSLIFFGILVLFFGVLFWYLLKRKKSYQ